MKKHRIGLLLCTLIPLLTVQACNTQPSFEQQPQSQPGWTTYTNGNYVTTMAFDHKGNLWTGGCGGIVKWNLAEHTYERYTALGGLANNEVHSIAVASDDTIWVGTGQGLSHFNGQDWATYDLSDGSVFRDIYAAIIDSFDGVWAASNTGLYRFDGETWLDADVVHSPNSVIQAPDGTLWVGDWDGISHFDGQNWTEYITDDIFPDDFAAVDSVRVLAVAPDGSVWGTAQESAPGQKGIGVFQFDGQVWTTYTTADGLADNTVYAAIISSDGNVWFATDAGVSRFDGENWVTYDKDDGLVSNSVRSIVEGSDGELLFGTQGFGISRFDGRTWTVYQTDDYLGPSSANAIVIDTDGSLWLGTDEGVYHFDDGTWSNYTQKDGLSSDKVTFIALASDGALWVTSANCCVLCSPPRGGLSRFNGQNWTTYAEAGECRYSVTVDDNDAVWFTGLYGSAFHFDGEALQSYPDDTEEELMGIGGVYRFGSSISIAPDGTVWFGGSDCGCVYRFDGETWTVYDESDGLPSQAMITSIAAAPNGNIWAGTTREGVSRFDGKSWMTFTKEDGLADNDIHVIAVAPDGAVWFTTANGLTRFDGETWTTHLPHNGLVTPNVTGIAFGSDGVLWATCSSCGGIMRYIPEN